LEIRRGHFLEVVIVDFSSAGRHQQNFGRTSTKNAQAAKSANAHCNFGAPRALRRSLSVIHSGILDFKQALSFFFKPRRISAARIKRIMINCGSLVDLFKLVIAFHSNFDAKRVVRDFRDLGRELYA
jgi:hypothetical protein